jgi:SulP family sulfate permease
LQFQLLQHFILLEHPSGWRYPSELPKFSFISFNFALLMNVLPAALTIALLGSIEALLCAVVCDGMTNTKHNSDKELVAQGVCNTVLPFFNAIPQLLQSQDRSKCKGGRKDKNCRNHPCLVLVCDSVVFLTHSKIHTESVPRRSMIFVSAKMINISEFKTIMQISRAETRFCS